MRALLVVLCLLAAEPLVGETVGLIDQPQTFPWTVGLAPVVQEEAGGLTPGALRLQTSVLWFNTYRQAGADIVQQVDMEGLLATVSGAWSPVSGWELRGQAQAWTLGGGIMDPALSGFHQVLGVPSQGRENAPQDGYRNYLSGAFDDKTPASGLTQASVGLRRWEGPWSLTGWVKLPVPAHTGWGWSSKWGGGLGAGWGGRWPLPWGRWTAEGGLSAALAVLEADPQIPGTQYPLTPQAGFYATAEWSPGSRFLVEGTWTRQPLDGPGYLSEGAGLLTMGVQMPAAPHWVWEGAVTEEFLTWATMEVGFQAGFVWTP